ncbi:MAG TPA: Ig-like domain-containing protein, partial [Candidatus Limnocylindria bacterium]|nr:Ig-like domain-containing protein [Candidatus Limnocylindria bacterium]
MGWGVGRQPGRRLLLGLAGIFAVSAVSAGLGTPAPTHVAAGGHGPDHWPPRPVAAAFEERWPPFDAVPGIPCYTSGPYLRVVYGYEAGRNNRIKQVDPLIREVVAYVDWLYNEAARASGGTRHIRWRMKDCRLEITTFAASAATLGDPTALNRALAQAGLLSGSEKALAFLDTAGWGCMGIAEMYPDDTPGQRNLNNTRSLVGLLFSECWTAPEARIMATEVAAHELSHTLGAVQDSAPHSTKFGHCWDGSDLMCYDDGWGPPKDVCALRSPERLDCNLDDYFSVKPKSDSYLARKWNVANSRWLAGTAPAKWERLPRARVAIDGPADKAVVAGRLRIGASSTAPAGYAIQRYVVVINGQRAGEIPADGSRPFRLDTFFDGDGSGYRNGEQLKVQVFAVDRHYRWSASAARRYTVSNPYIYLRRPTAYDSASGNLAWAVDATPGQGRTISKVELLVNGKVVAADTTKPYGGTWNAGSNPLSTVRIAARLTDDRGLARRTAERWLEPAAGGQVQLAWDGWGGRSVTDRALIVARVSSPEAVARVRFLLGSVEIGNDTSAPYALDWTPTAAGNVVARAELASGRVLVSEPMTVTLAAPAGNSLTVSASTAALPASGTVELQATPTPATGWSV